MTELIKQFLDILPQLKPINGKTWLKKFYKLSFVNFLLSLSLMASMFLNTTIFGVFLSNFIFLIIFTLILVNDANFFYICMERLLDADLNPYLAMPLFLLSIFIVYVLKLSLALLIETSSFYLAIMAICSAVFMNTMLFVYLPSKK